MWSIYEENEEDERDNEIKLIGLRRWPYANLMLWLFLFINYLWKLKLNIKSARKVLYSLYKLDIDYLNQKYSLIYKYPAITFTVAAALFTTTRFMRIPKFFRNPLEVIFTNII